MSERERQRRLSVQGRLADLNAKYGPVDDHMPDWLDHMPEASQDAPKSPQQAAEPTSGAKTAPQPLDHSGAPGIEPTRILGVQE